MARLSTTYGLNGEPETRIEREFDNLYKTKGDAAMVKYFAMPNVQTVPQLQLILVKESGKWYTVIRIDDTLYRMTEWIAI